MSLGGRAVKQTHGVFDDILAANRAYAGGFELAGLAPSAARGLGVVTCIDSRIEPLQMLGLAPGDAKILRNAADASRTTSCARSYLRSTCSVSTASASCSTPDVGCSAVPTTSCRPRSAAMRDADASGWDFLPIADHDAVLRADADVLRACPLLPPDLAIGGFVYDVDTGELHPITD